MIKQVGDWPAARAVERTIHHIHFAPGSEPVKLPVGLRNIIATDSKIRKRKLTPVRLHMHIGTKPALSTEPLQM